MSSQTIAMFIVTAARGRAIAQAVSCRLPGHVGFVVDKVALGQVSSEDFGFPQPIFIPPIVPQSPSSVIWSWYNRLVVAAVPSGLSLTPLLLQVPHISCIEKKDFWIMCVYHCVHQGFSNFVTPQPPKIIRLCDTRLCWSHCCRSLVRLYDESRNLTSFAPSLHLQ
jgi:hypothetical protein